MKVSTTQPFQIVYSVFQHEYLGYLFESFVVQINSRNELTFQHQNISSQNAPEFAKGLDELDYQLIKLIEQIQQDYIVKKFYHKKVSISDFFFKVYNKQKGNKALQESIDRYLEEKRQAIISKLQEGKQVFVMGRDGHPAWKRLQFASEAATVLFHFRRNEEDTHYFPTIKYKNEKLEFYGKGGFIICNEPAWMVLEDTLYYFADNVDGNKIKPFLQKKFIKIPRKIEHKYYRTFVSQLVAYYDVFAKGFAIKTHRLNPDSHLLFSEYKVVESDLFGKKTEDTENGTIRFNLYFHYGQFKLLSIDLNGKNLLQQEIYVHLDQHEDDYTFQKIYRDSQLERTVLRSLKQLGLEIKNGTGFLPKGKAFKWISQHQATLKEIGIQVDQETKESKKYFIGKAEINLEIKENKDWFDIYATIRFGEFVVPFIALRKLILQQKTEFTLPNGETAVIPDAWIEQYSELFAFSEAKERGPSKLKKFHLSLVEELKRGKAVQVTIDQKLKKFHDFEKIEDYPLPAGFKGKLRSYQKAGYNWLRFLNNYHFGGCLADDMGLGKTVQTLAMLQHEKENSGQMPSLLIIPTSLIYNWELEAKRFTPSLNVFTYTGTNRDKNVEYFQNYDLIITSYGIIRIDIDIVRKFFFNYVILDESQAIKNPNSNISQAVRKLRCQNRLILTGTPLENTTLDLWSQMSFINPGLLGGHAFFKNEYLNPIEKKNNHEKREKLSRIIKPFILRRLKSQVALDLPSKVEHVQFCLMTATQEKEYERVKSQYRNEIIKQIEQQGMIKSQFLLLQGLNKLRQIANHPQMIDQGYTGDSGKQEDIQYKLESIISEGHKVLIFSQFVKHLDILRKHLNHRKWNYAYLDGSTKDRQHQVQQFQSDIDTRIFLISLKAGGVGLNLTAAEYVFLIDPWWNPAIEAQAVDRAHRIGQKNKVFTYKFITKNSVEEKILALQKDKKKLAEQIITTEEGFVKSLSREDVLNLLD